MQVISRATGKMYQDHAAVYIVNPQQAWAYVNAGAELLDLFPRDDKRLVFVFDRMATKDLYTKWCDRSL